MYEDLFTNGLVLNEVARALIKNGDAERVRDETRAGAEKAVAHAARRLTASDQDQDAVKHFRLR
jgi:hypothetical protein